jgi:hypothetical protein
LRRGGSLVGRSSRRGPQRKTKAKGKPPVIASHSLGEAISGFCLNNLKTSSPQGTQRGLLKTASQGKANFWGRRLSLRLLVEALCEIGSRYYVKQFRALLLQDMRSLRSDYSFRLRLWLRRDMRDGFAFSLRRYVAQSLSLCLSLCQRLVFRSDFSPTLRYTDTPIRSEGTALPPSPAPPLPCSHAPLSPL